MEEVQIGFELRSLSNMIKRYFEFSSHKKEIETITGNNSWIIGYLSRNADKDIFQRDIEDHFKIARSTASRVLSLMEQKELILRQAVTHDARLKKIVLTEKASKIQELMKADIMQLEQTLIKGFTRDEVENLYTFIQRMKDNIAGD
ncbi:MarR family winged helix-turn-helix transcriptional regulator [Fusibacter ferrireducens]|uniref:MarR family transcriptional regulator n=1 Tax=Fusibacter ferrireducens TaxID=2785058 RepID=A0ABR9ZQ15_9FIRM|nr:MarR family transcriptional regulator [Fusibacter ferrireducens]MBF4692548.1 MarR family transcriptional regulator [Fusibacter ferrireducens]